MLSENEIGTKITQLCDVLGDTDSTMEYIERAREISRMGDILGLRDSNSLISMMIVLDAYRMINKKEQEAIKGDFLKARENIRRILDKELEIASKKAELDAKKREQESSERFTSKINEILERLTGKVLELADKSAMAASGRRLVMWICATVFACFVCYGGITSYIGYKNYEAGYFAGVANARDENLELKKRDDFWTSELGQRIFDDYKSGRLQTLTAFLDSSLGKKILELKEKGLLGGIIAFFESLPGQLALVYPAETLESILTCDRDGWKVEKQKNRQACYPNNKGAFWIPNSVHLAEKPKLPKALGEIVK